MWLFFTLVTTLLWGAAELFYKKGSHEEKKYDSSISLNMEL